MLGKIKRCYRRLVDGHHALENRISALERSLSDAQSSLSELDGQVHRLFDHVSASNTTPKTYEYLSAEYLPLLTATSPGPKKRILLCGFYGAQNTGDELMLQGLLAALPNPDNYEITILLSNNFSINASEYAPYKVIHYPSRSSDILALASYFDYIIIGGGAVLDDTDYRFREECSSVAYLLLSIAKTALLCQKTVFVLSVSTNRKLSNPNFLSDLEYIINHAAFFSVRDSYSLETLRRAHLPVTKVSLSDDLALALPWLQSTPSKPQYSIGLIPIISDATRASLRELIFRLASSSNELLLVPFYNYQDTDLNFFQSLLPELKAHSPKTHIAIAPQPKTAADLTAILDSCDIIISMRYHATLLAGISGRKVLSLDFGPQHPHYYNKVQYIAKQYVPGLLNIDFSSQPDEIISALNSLRRHSARPNRPAPQKVIQEVQRALAQGGIR